MKFSSWSVWFALCAWLVGTVAFPLTGLAASLYSEQTYRPLTADNKAFRVGDVLTVQVYENSSASTSADTDTRRKNTISAQLALNAKPVTGTSRGISADTSISASGDFEGGGRTQRANRLLATLTVTVLEVLPSGELKVAGEQQLTVNGERQKVTLEGRVRSQDISDLNVVMSTRLADARITYVGQGDITERQQRGLWRKFMDSLGF